MTWGLLAVLFVELLLVLVQAALLGDWITAKNSGVSAAWATWIYTGLTMGIFGASLAAARFAYMALSAWQKQIGGNYEFEIAKNGIAKLIAVKYAALNMKNYFLDEDQGEDWAKQRRLQLSQALAELNTTLFGASLVWGGEIEDDVRNLNQHLHELALASNIIFEKKRVGAIDEYYDLLGFPRPNGPAVPDEIQKHDRRRAELLASIEGKLANVMKKYLPDVKRQGQTGEGKT